LIKSVNEVIDFLDVMEEMRNLLVEENCLRNFLNSHVLTLLKNQKIYWKQRGKIKWVKLGDENTKFFHTRARINFRHNKIVVLQNDDLADITDHDGKVEILWKAFKERMGTSGNSSMQFNLEDLCEPISSDMRNSYSRSAWRAMSPGASCTVASGRAMASEGEVRSSRGRVHSGGFAGVVCRAHEGNADVSVLVDVAS
jgi:hypothetical protein